MNRKGKPLINFKYIIRKTLKVLAWFGGAVVLLLLLVWIAVQFPATQNFLARKAVGFVEQKIDTRFSISGIDLDFPQSIVLKEIYLEDLHQDTLLYSGRLAINLGLFNLLSRKIMVEEIALADLAANIRRKNADSTFNYQFIIDAFAAKPATPPDTSAASWKIGLEQVDLANARFIYDDKPAGQKLALKIGRGMVDIAEFDIDNLNFLIKNFALDESALAYYKGSSTMTPSRHTDTKNDDTGLRLNIRNTSIQNTSVDFADDTQDMALTADLGGLLITSDNFDLESRQIALEDFQLDNSTVKFSHIQPPVDSIGANPGKPREQAPDSIADEGWSFSLDRLSFSDNRFAYDNNYAGDSIAGFTDFNHLDLTTGELKARAMEYQPGLIRATISNALLSEARGINIGGLQVEVDISGQETSIDLTRFNVNGSSLAAHLVAEFNALTASENQMTGKPAVLEIQQAAIAVPDLIMMQPSLANALSFLGPKEMVVNLHGKASGSLRDLKIHQLEVVLGDTTRLSAAGRLTGITAPDEASFDIRINKLISDKTDLSHFIAKDLWPASLDWPQSLHLSAYVNGSMDDFRGNLETSLYGGQFSTEFAGGQGDKNAFTFSGEYSLKQFNLGTLLKNQKLYGPVTMTGNWQGSRTRPGEVSGTHTVNIDSLTVNNYTYTNIRADSELAGKLLQTTLQSKDDNLIVDLENTIDFSDRINTYGLKLELEKADLQATHWADEPIALRGRMKSNLSFTSLNDLNGDLDIRKVEIIKNGTLYKVDSLLFLSVNQTGKSELNIESDVLYADFKGNINFTSLPDAITNFINVYYPLDATIVPGETGLQTFNFEVDIRNSDMLTEVLVPGLSRFEPAVIKGSFNNQQQEVDITLDIPTMTYQDVRIDSLFFGLDTDKDKLAYQFNIDYVRGKNMEVNNFSIYGNFMRDSIDAHLAVLDSTGNKRWFVEASVVREEEDHVIRIFPENFMLNYEKWQVSPDNQIKLGRGRVYDSKLLISKGGQEIKIASDYNEKDNPYVTIDISQLNLADVSRIVDNENGAVSGLLNADFNLESTPSSVNYRGELKIADFGILAGKLGNLSLLARHEGNQRHFLDLNLQNEVNRMKASGYIDLSGEATTLNVNVNMTRLSLSSVEALTFGALEDMEGLISGDFDVSGTTIRPGIDGTLQFDDVRFRVDYLNSYFGIKNESIALTDNNLIFNKFEIFDDDGDKAEVNGALSTRDYIDFTYDLTIDAKRFKILDTGRDSQQPYFGKLYVNSLIKLSGNTDKPAIDLDLKVLEGTDLTYVVPQTEVGNIRRKGLVEFIDQDVDSDPFYQELYETATEDTLRAALTGIDLTASIAVDDKSSLTILVDPVSGDFLSLNGNADLNLGIIPSGEISLSGRYEVAQGRYELSFYKLVKREFDLQKGSYLIWTGDPYNPRLNITAIYTTEASTYELISDQMIGESSGQLKQRVPVQLHMNMQGLLMSPEISFRFDMPEDDRQALGGAPYAKLLSLNNDESSLNKQVFALLTLKRFIADDPLNTSGNTVESQARNSVSRILTSELNKLTDDVDVVDISLNVESYEDYSSGNAEGRTALELGVSREFLDDRVVVNVAGNFDLEGNQGNQNNISDYIGDLLIEYKLTEDGRFRLTGFRRSEYESIINQEVVGTGVGVIFVRDYNAFRELFNTTE